ncbi:forkhead box protein N3 isoform X1 [Anabrus simplex]|uniref:forkhead box protein N3 isoform X1 n=1 Tax=Anabrus simplex TaxID=316456 RepID=UPI0035A32DEE
MMAPERPGPENEPGVAMVQRSAVTIPVIPVFSLPSSLMQLKEGDGASNILTTMKVEMEEKPNSEDDDLTSLTWLQDKNLLKGMNLRAAVGEAQEESPTSDYVDDSASEPADSTSSSGHSPSPAPLPLVATVQPPSKLKHPQHMPYDPLVHVNSKPPYSFSCLIFMAIEDSPNRALPVKEIYAWILQHFPYFKNAPTGWKNSVRHNLSLNKCFRKVEKAPNLGKGSLWMVDSVYRPNLLQALQKSPFYPFRSLDRVSMATKHVHVPSRRLAASGVEGLRSCELPRADSDTTTDDADSLDDGDAAAATAMLALKHGPRMLSPRKPEWYKRPDNEEQALDMRHARKKMRASKNTQDLDSDNCIPVITTSPSEDHTYSAGHTVLPTSSPDEAYEEGSESEDDPKPLAVNGVRPRTTAKPSLLSDAEEQRKIAEGADALLNLAGITTRKRSQSSEFQTAPSETTSETPVSRASLRGRRRSSGGVGFRPRLLRSVRPIKKSSAGSSSVGSVSAEPPRQRVAHRRKSQNPVSINTNNNTIDAGTNNNNNIAKVAKTLKQMQRNTIENEGVGRTKR